jgi:hypothetical protein
VLAEHSEVVAVVELIFLHDCLERFFWAAA